MMHESLLYRALVSLSIESYRKTWWPWLWFMLEGIERLDQVEYLNLDRKGSNYSNIKT
eukprot:SAG31_NODE_4726_length_3005_cov_6.928424_3_plen_58_part_00